MQYAQRRVSTAACPPPALPGQKYYPAGVFEDELNQQSFHCWPGDFSPSSFFFSIVCLSLSVQFSNAAWHFAWFVFFWCLRRVIAYVCRQIRGTLIYMRLDTPTLLI
jgi:hypothetical protein